MKKISIEKEETKIALELTQTEFNTLITHFAVANTNSARNHADSHGLKVADKDGTNGLYESLLEFAKEMNKL